MTFWMQNYIFSMNFPKKNADFFDVLYSIQTGWYILSYCIELLICINLFIYLRNMIKITNFNAFFSRISCAISQLFRNFAPVFN